MISPKIFGNYEIIRELGRGGMGIVYLAKDVRIDRLVALKELILDPNLSEKDKEETVVRFKREAQAAGRLSHPNIVTLYDVGEDHRTYYIAMEYLEGTSLKDILAEKGKLPLNEAIRVVRQLAIAMDYAHQQSIVHRDLKPDNVIILRDGTIKLTDFGIARVGTAPSVTQTGSMLGTLAYISPEQLHDSKSVDGRADIFSLGALFYELLTGKLPFEGDSIGSTILKIMSETPLPPSFYNPLVPKSIDVIVEKALKKKPSERYQHAIAMAEDLDKALVNVGESGTSVSTPQAASETKCKRCGTPLAPNAKFCPNCGMFITQQRAASVTLPPITGTRAEISDLKVFSCTVVREFGRRGIEKGNFMSPRGIAISSKNFVYVADTENNRVQIFDPFLSWHLTFSHPPLKSPFSVAVSDAGRIFLLGATESAVFVFDERGNFIRELSGSIGSMTLGTPSAVVVSRRGNLFVSDPTNYRIFVFDGNLNYIRSISTKGGPQSETIHPRTIAVDHEENLYVMDYTTSRIHVYNTVGILLASFGKKGISSGELSLPRALAVDQHKRIYVADTFNNRIQIYDHKGNWLYAHGERGNGPGHFLGPEGLAMAPNGDLYAVDKGNHRVQVLHFEWRA